MLWHRLVDSDIVLLLDTQKFLESQWTKKELAEAYAMSIGILQVVWPDHNRKPWPPEGEGWLLRLEELSKQFPVSPEDLARRPTFEGVEPFEL